MIVTEIKIGDEIGHTKVVWMMSYYDKERYRVIWFVCISKIGTYDIFVHNKYNILNEWDKGDYDSLPLAVKTVMKVMKTECKLKHIHQ